MKDINETILIYHHNDNDGYLSAAIAQAALRDEAALIMYPGDFNEEVPIKLIEAVDTVFILDYLIPWEIMVKYHEKIIWIDHHKERIAHAQVIEMQAGWKFNGLTTVGRCGALLTWDYFHGEAKIVDIPYVVDLVNDRDVWEWRMGDLTGAFHEASRIFITDYNKWESLLTDDNETAEEVKRGTIILQHMRDLITEIIDSYAWRAKFKGYNVAFLNCPITVSGEIHRILREKHPDCDFVLIYYDLRWATLKQAYIYRINENIDLRLIAAEYEGSGRPESAGFYIKQEDWNKALKEAHEHCSTNS